MHKVLLEPVSAWMRVFNDDAAKYLARHGVVDYEFKRIKYNNETVKWFEI